MHVVSKLFLFPRILTIYEHSSKQNNNPLPSTPSIQSPRRPFAYHIYINPYRIWRMPARAHVGGAGTEQI